MLTQAQLRERREQNIAAAVNCARDLREQHRTCAGCDLQHYCAATRRETACIQLEEHKRAFPEHAYWSPRR